jgi:hypothetical protein
VNRMEQAKQAKKALVELTQCGIELHQAVQSTGQITHQTQKLWREGNKSNLTKIGVACILFPDPSPIGEIVGAGFLIAGAVQKGVQKRTLYVSDFKKNLCSIQNELRSTRNSLRL